MIVWHLVLLLVYLFVDKFESSDILIDLSVLHVDHRKLTSHYNLKNCLHRSLLVV